MKTSSCKAKGRALCKHVKEIIVKWFDRADIFFNVNDIKVTSSGASGEDLQFSEYVRKFLPISIECKNLASIAIYKHYEQCKSNADRYEPILIVKQNNSKPLAIMDLDYWLKLESERVHDRT